MDAPWMLTTHPTGDGNVLIVRGTTWAWIALINVEEDPPRDIIWADLVGVRHNRGRWHALYPGFQDPTFRGVRLYPLSVRMLTGEVVPGERLVSRTAFPDLTFTIAADWFSIRSTTTSHGIAILPTDDLFAFSSIRDCARRWQYLSLADGFHEGNPS